ncbi:ANTAR domain-containing protein [Streptomyces sp. S3(2020)]|uniref:ANTAR domain-containing protein n=1 Tax=Streptomyces sp. S3(2020) TaxID=2732044 RepID=UPI001489AE52|nr:ANTAR domain-containing protein [Streptomyces sp. S3(2020)]NNN29923.1 ANTAR domain-containing protein [Streptomyces sp. S3(2020)]
MTEPGQTAADDGADHDEQLRLRAEVRDLRARARAHALIAEAQGVLRERYALSDADSAFTLMRLASQRFNVKMRTLAEILLSAPRPRDREAPWFPRRARLAQPALSFPAARRVGPGNRGGVLKAVLTQTLAVVGTDMGNVQLVDRVRGGLRIEAHTGLTADFVDFFGHVGEHGTSCARAARDVAQVTVHDVETDPVFTASAREAILAAGSRACHSVPLTTASGLCVGMVSAHLDHPLGGLTTAQLKALEAVGAQAGQWLAWHERTVVLDALEYLHALGNGSAQP